MKNEKLYVWLAFVTGIILLVVMCLVMGLLKGCGVAPTGKKVIQTEAPPVVISEPPACEDGDGQPSRSLPCPDGLLGAIIQVCSEGDKWQEISNTCSAKPDTFSSLDYVESLKLGYLTSLANSVDRLNTRFIDFSQARILNLPMDNAYKAFNRALNSVSFNQDIYKCKPLDEFETTCAVDIRELSQTRAKYDQIAINADLPFESKTTKGLVIQQLTGTKLPSLHYDELMATVFGKVNVYYGLLGFLDSVQAFSLFGIDEAKQIVDLEYASIGTNLSGITSARNTRLIQIYESDFNGRSTICSASYDNPALAGADRDLFQSPFLDETRSKRIYKFEASEVLCLLPNNLMSYVLHNNKNILVDHAPENIVHCNNANCLDATIDISDCMNCHQTGFLPKSDVVRDHILESGVFNAEEVELAKAVYLTGQESDELWTRLNAVYKQGLDNLGYGASEDNHFILAYNNYFRGQTKEQIAAFLYIKPEALEECITSSAILRDQLGSLLTGGQITHDTFKGAFQTLLDECKLNVDPLVRPEQ